jgi:hypothetical protein
MSNPNTKTISVTMWTGQADLIAQAAKKLSEKAGHTVSVSAIIRDATIPAAAKILGVEVPEFDDFEAPHFRRGNISLAAEALGMTVEQFKQHQAKIAADAVLDSIRKAQEQQAPAAAKPAVIRRRRAG